MVWLFLAAAGQPELQSAVLNFSFIGLLFWMALWDVRTLRVPNRIVSFALGFGTLGSLFLGRHEFLQALMGGAIAFTSLLVIAILGRGAFGFGDVKVGTVAGLAVGLNDVLSLLTLAFASGGLVALAALASRRRKRRDVIAFTPFLVAATLVSVLSLDLIFWR